MLQAEKIVVGEFSSANLLGWQEKEFKGKTKYELKRVNDKVVLAATSSNTASALFKVININLNKTPVIHWSWKVKNITQHKNERTKSGDDFTARVYILFSDGPFLWQPKTLNYLWANQSNIGEHWPNPYTNNAQMLAIQSGSEHTNQWRNESRDVLQDIQRVFGKSITEISAVAIMTDTDQTGTVTQAWFGDIWFSDH